MISAIGDAGGKEKARVTPVHVEETKGGSSSSWPSQIIARQFYLCPQPPLANLHDIQFQAWVLPPSLRFTVSSGTRWEIPFHH